MAARIVTMLVLAALVAGGLWMQQRTIIAQAKTVAELEADKAALERNLAVLRAGREADNLVTKQAAEQAERMTSRARALEYRLREALHAEVDADRVLSRGVTDALCLRYGAASGANGGDPTDSAGCADAGAGHSAAAGNRQGAVLNCDAWTGMTVRNALEWAGLLLDHAGLERTDKQALRDWAAKTAQPRSE